MFRGKNVIIRLDCVFICHLSTNYGRNSTQQLTLYLMLDGEFM